LAGNFQRRPSLTRTVDAATLADFIRDGATAGGDAYLLIDARTQARFDGREEPIDAVAGHIPGAACLPFQENLDAAGAFRSPAELQERFSVCAQGSADVVSYCGSGVTATHNILAMRVAGYPEPILYPGSWSEWIVDPARPQSPQSPRSD
jgi:thiosulfate/3-mercaptopyruvate sulfurtransferase